MNSPADANPALNKQAEPVRAALNDCPSGPRRSGSTLPVQTVHRLENVNAITDDAIEAVIWDRILPPCVPHLLHTAPGAKSVSTRVTAGPGEVAAEIPAFTREQDIGSTAFARWLAEDIRALAAQFAEILSVDAITLRVEVIRDDACRKFHRDAVRARMICTYIGPGTEYGVAPRGCEPERIDTVATGCPAFLKGKAWSDAERPSLLHRSPPIGDTGVSRLVVVIDAAD